MWVRARLRIKWRDILFGTKACVTGMDRQEVLSKIENYWPDQAPAMVTYSVRSGFDLLLQALRLDPGDEILFSAINIKGMVSIVKRERYQPVPVDIDLAHMAPRLDCLEKAITPKSKVLVIAHLFGSRADIGPIIELAHKHGLIVVEDCAQAFFGKTFNGHEKSDVCMFSFDPLKTTTALGGAIIRVADKDLRQSMRNIQATYQIQTNKDQFVRVLKFAAVKFLTTRGCLAVVHRVLKARGKTFDDLLANPIRNIAMLGSAKKLRFRPSTALLRLLAYRLHHFNEAEFNCRQDLGATLSSLIGSSVVQPALKNKTHGYWVFPVVSKRPLEFISALRAQGFDAADLPRSRAVAAPDDRPELHPKTAEKIMQNLVILPCYPEMSSGEINRLAACVKDAAKAS